MACKEKWILYDNQQQLAQWLDWEEAPKHFPKPNLHQKKIGDLMEKKKSSYFANKGPSSQSYGSIVHQALYQI